MLTGYKRRVLPPGHTGGRGWDRRQREPGTVAAGDCGGFRRREREARRARLRTAGIPSEAPGAGAPASANPAGGRGGAGRGARPVQQPHSRGAGSGTAVCTWSSGLSRNWLLGEGGLSARCPRAQSNRKRKGIANTPCPQKAHTLTWAWTLPGRGSHALQPAAPLVDTQPLFPCVHRKGPLVPPGPEQAG